MGPKTFRKEERLCSKRSIGDLFRNGSSFVLYPYRVVYRWSGEADGSAPSNPVRVLISVPKRRFRKAVDRNRIKRRMKEAYRLQKGVLVDAIRTARAPQSRDGEPLEQQAVRLDIAIQFVAAEAKDFSLIYRKMTEVLSKLHKEYGKVYLGQDH